MISIGVAAYNEERSLGAALETILRATHQLPFEVIAVVGGSDRTVELARSFAHMYSNFVVVEEGARRGKPWAINQILELAQGDLIMLTDADVKVETTAFRMLVTAFDDHTVGAACARVIPSNDRGSIFGFWAHLLFTIAHERRLRSQRTGRILPLTGYLCAVRRGAVNAIPEDTLADDAALGILVRRNGFRIVYVPEARVHVKFPESLRDFFLQKRRTMAGFYQIDERYGVKERSLTLEAREGFLYSLRFCRNLSELAYVLVLYAARMWTWLLALWDFKIRRRTLTEIWRETSTTIVNYENVISDRRPERFS